MNTWMDGMEMRTDEWTDEWTDGMYGWNGKATMTTMPDDDDNEYDELLSSLLTRKCQSAKMD